MKNSIQLLILILTFFFTKISNAQKLVEIGNQWNIVTLPTFSPNTSSYSLLIGGDTLVDNITYNKVLFSNDSLNTVWKYTGYNIRQDSTKKVYHKIGNGDEMLLYDFNLGLNDSFFIPGYCTLTVNGIDSVVLNNGEPRKRLRLGVADIPNWGETYWIDGIGSNYGMINHFGFCLFDYSDVLLCFYSDSELLYPASPPSCFITNIDELNTDDIEIFPNPINNALNINDGQLILKKYYIYNVIGKVILTGNLKDPNNTINMSNMDPGHYIIILEDKIGNFYSQKLIKN